MIQILTVDVQKGHKIDIVISVDEFGNSTEASFKVCRYPSDKQIELDARKLFTVKQKYVFNYKLIGFRVGIDYIYSKFKKHSL